MSIKETRIVVVDDHVLFRRGLIGLLEEMPGFVVVGEAGNGKDAIHIVHQTTPHIVLMDVNMPGMDGINAVEKLRAERAPVRILMLTISKNDADLLGAIRAGADGYLLKNAEPEELRKAILKVTEGQGVISPEVTGGLFRALTQSPEMVDSPVLSDRELEVLKCMASGQTTQQISMTLFITENTVKTHVRHILEKMNAANRTEAVSKAIQMGLLSTRSG